VISGDPATIRRLAGRGLVAGLCVAAFAAVVALLGGEFDDTEARVILTSIGFSVCSSLAGAGASARLGRSETARSLGLATIVLSVAAFVLLAIGLWSDDWGSEGIWRSFGTAAVLAVAGAHAGAVLAARRETDSDTVRALSGLSVGLGGADTFGALLPIVGIVDGVDEAGAKLLGIGLVLLVLTTALPPILRRIARPAAARPSAAANPEAALADEVLAVADRLDVLNAGPGNRAPEIRAEVARLRRLARSFQA
jgi:hypothetical protein